MKETANLLIPVSSFIPLHVHEGQSGHTRLTGKVQALPYRAVGGGHGVQLKGLVDCQIAIPGQRQGFRAEKTVTTIEQRMPTILEAHGKISLAMKAFGSCPGQPGNMQLLTRLYFVELKGVGEFRQNRG